MNFEHFSIPFSQIRQLSKTDKNYVTASDDLRGFYKYPVHIDSFKQVIEDKQRQLGSQVFSYEMMNMPIDDSIAEFKKEHIQTFEEDKLKHINTNTYITVDTAISEKTSADFTGITINRVSQENKWYVTCYKIKVNPKDLIDHLFHLQDTYRPSMFGIEKTTFTMGIKPFLEDEMRNRNKFLNIKELTHTTQSKETRIRALIPRWESKSIFFVGNCDDLVQEMRTFPRGNHDDVLDSLAMQEEIAEKPINMDEWDRILGNNSVMYPDIGI